VSDMEIIEITYPLLFKAAFLEQNNKPLIIDDVMFSGPLGVGQVLVRIYYSGICGKQIEEIKGTGGPDPFLPHMLGHEGSGVVVDIGPGVKKVKPGDCVVLHWLKGSGIDAETPFYTCNEKRINAGWITTFNEYGVISENRLTPIPRGTDMAIACLLGCAVTTGIGTVLHDAKLCPGDSIAIFGCGGVGLSAVQGAVLVHGHPIIAIDRNAKSLDMALKFGASHTINPDSENVLEKIGLITGGKGVNSVIITVNAPQVIEMAVKAGAIPGTVSVISVPPANSTIAVDPLAIHRRRTLIGSYGGGTVPDIDIPRYLALYHRGHLKLKELIQTIIPLSRINDGIDAHLSGKGGRCIVRMFDEDM